MMLYSGELRWFFVGSTPADVVAWFDANQERLEHPRTDSYLIFIGSQCVGVKFREVPEEAHLNFEIKALCSAPRTVEPRPGIIGKADAWVKWSVKFKRAEDLRQTMREGSRWIDVEKK